jgi:hypothetical protein
VDDLLEKLLRLDRARCTPEAQACRKQRRLLDEIRRRAMSDCERAVERVLAGVEAEPWIARLNRAEVSLDAVISHLAAAALGEVQRAASDD